jgi:hypothetical protein
MKYKELGKALNNEKQRVAEEEKVRNEIIDALRRIEPDEYLIDVNLWPADSFGKKVIDSKNYTMMRDILKEIEEGEAEAKKEAERQKQLEIEQQQARILELEEQEKELNELAARIASFKEKNNINTDKPVDIDELILRFQKANESLENELKKKQKLIKEELKQNKVQEIDKDELIYNQNQEIETLKALLIQKNDEITDLKFLNQQLLHSDLENVNNQTLDEINLSGLVEPQD